MLAEERLGVGEEASNEVDEVTILVVRASVLKDAEELVSVDLVEGLLLVHEEQAALVPHAEDLGDALRGAPALLEAMLVQARSEELRLRADDLV